MPRRTNPRGCRGQKRNRRSSKQQTSNIGWPCLPPELREMILQALEDSLQGGKAASYASVSKKWNRMLEPYIFKRLELSIGRIHELKDIVSDRRQTFVQFIWFRFRRSPCSSILTVYEDSQSNHIKFAYTIYCLFQILSEWDIRKEGQPGIVLELSAFSNADPDDSMKDTVPKELRNVDITEDSDALNAMYEKTPVRQMIGLPRISAVDETLLSLYHPTWSRMVEAPFPTVRLITDLTVRRQMHSSFFGQHMGRLVKALPRLEFITYEPSSQSLDREGQTRSWNIQPVEDILNSMPSTIRRLQVLEDDSSLYDPDQGLRPRRTGRREALGQLVANISRDKEPEALAMSFIIDARDFFADFATPQGTLPQDNKLEWTNLTSLVLTSSVIRPHCNRLQPLLEAASRAACHMPKLEIMELYHAAESHGGIFTYIHDEEGSIMLWECNWEWTLPTEVIDVWKMTARVHGTEVLDYKSSWIPSRDLGWPARIISLLRTRETVIHPYTYYNMMSGLNYM